VAEVLPGGGNTDLHFHDLRHEAASRLLEQGWPLQHVQAMLGHADAKTTSIYLNVTFHQLAESARRFVSPERPLHDLAQDENASVGPSGNGDQVTTANALVN
jgi:integrase